MSPTRPSTLVMVLPSAIALAVLILSLYLMDQFSTPLNPAGEEKTVIIQKGMGVADIGKLLEREGIIKSHRMFALLALLEGQAHRLKAGEYRLSAAMNTSEILYALREGKIYYHKITVPEGFTIKEIAGTLEKEGLVSAQEFIKEATNPALISSLNVQAKSLEGYLFPETYYFSSHISAREIIETMFSALEKSYTPAFRRREQALGMNRHQILTLASIIEEEAKTDGERPLISSVFHNRLGRGIPLQADPTIRYALGGYPGPITENQLKAPSPYNTYLHKGMPPGPISSPGLSSIRAALHPASTSYLYFVALEDGTHKFSTTLREHNRAIRSLRKK